MRVRCWREGAVVLGPPPRTVRRLATNPSNAANMRRYVVIVSLRAYRRESTGMNVEAKYRERAGLMGQLKGTIGALRYRQDSTSWNTGIPSGYR